MYHDHESMYLPASSSDLIKESTFSLVPNSVTSFSSFSRSTSDFIAEKPKEALSRTGEESLDEAMKSIIEL